MLPRRLADCPQGSDRRGAQPRDRLHDAVLRGLVRAGLRVRAGAGREAARGRRGRHPVDRDRVRRARWRWAGRSNASASPRRCARCCWRRRRAGDLRRQAARHRRCCWRRRARAGAARRRCCSRRRCLRIRSGSRCARDRHVGFAAVGTLFAAMLVRARSRDVLLPVLLYPITVPVIIAGVRGTAALLQPTPNSSRRALLGRAARRLRRRLRDAGAVDVRTADDGLDDTESYAEVVSPPAAVVRCADVRVVAVPDRERALRVDDGAGAEDLLLPHAVGVDVPARRRSCAGSPARASCSPATPRHDRTARGGRRTDGAVRR